jgi:hypothetical protein
MICNLVIGHIANVAHCSGEIVGDGYKRKKPRIASGLFYFSSLQEVRNYFFLGAAFLAAAFLGAAFFAAAFLGAAFAAAFLGAAFAAAFLGAAFFAAAFLGAAFFAVAMFLEFNC